MSEIRKRKTLWTLAGIALLTGVSLLAFAGELEPPGPPAPTMKDLDTVEARTPIRASDLPLSITLPGSYYLVEDITASAGGISIGTTCVTIDLNGFALYGAGFAGDGISTVAGVENVEIRNGVVFSWGQDGIDMTNATNVRLLDLRVTDNVGNGVVLGDDSVLRDSTINGNTGNGVELVGQGSLVQDNVIHSNTMSGIWVDGDAHQIRDNSITANQTYGIFVTNFSDSQIIVDNLFTNNVTLSLEFTEFSVGHVVARNIGTRSGPNYNQLAGDWGPVSTAAAATNPAGNINN